MDSLRKRFKKVRRPALTATATEQSSIQHHATTNNLNVPHSTLERPAGSTDDAPLPELVPKQRKWIPRDEPHIGISRYRPPPNAPSLRRKDGLARHDQLPVRNANLQTDMSMHDTNAPADDQSTSPSSVEMAGPDEDDGLLPPLPVQESLLDIVKLLKTAPTDEEFEMLNQGSGSRPRPKRPSASELRDTNAWIETKVVKPSGSDGGDPRLSQHSSQREGKAKVGNGLGDGTPLHTANSSSGSGKWFSRKSRGSGSSDLRQLSVRGPQVDSLSSLPTNRTSSGAAAPHTALVGCTAGEGSLDLCNCSSCVARRTASPRSPDPIDSHRKATLSRNFSTGHLRDRAAPLRRRWSVSTTSSFGCVEGIKNPAKEEERRQKGERIAANPLRKIVHVSNPKRTMRRIRIASSEKQLKRAVARTLRSLDEGGEEHVFSFF